MARSKLTLGRRKFLKAGLALGAVQLGGLCSPTILRAQGSPIKIGIILPKSGTYAIQSEHGWNGVQQAAKDFGGKILGRPLEFVWLDEPNPQGAQQNVTKLINQDKVVAVSGGVSSGAVLASMPVAERMKIPFMATGPNASEITGEKCSRYTFRVDIPNRIAVRALYPVIATSPNLRWYSIYASYAWGTDAHNQMLAQIQSGGGDLVGADQAPLGTTDFSSYILKVRQAKPDIVFLGIGGLDLVNFVKQFKEIGLKGKIPIASAIVNDVDLWSMGQDAATGYYPIVWNFADPNNAPKSREFAEAYQAAFGMPPEVQAWQDWFGVTSLLTAIKETQSTSGKDIVQFLEGHTFEGFKKDPIWFGKADHQLVQSIYIAKVKDKIDDKYRYLDIVSKFPEGYSNINSIFKSDECKMGSI